MELSKTFTLLRLQKFVPLEKKLYQKFYIWAAEYGFPIRPKNLDRVGNVRTVSDDALLDNPLQCLPLTLLLPALTITFP